MRRITIAVMSTISALVALFSYHTSTNSQAAASTGTASSGTSSGAAASSNDSSSSGPSSSASSGSSGSSSSGSSGSSSSSSSAKSGSSSSGKSGTYTGDEANTRWGLVQVRITVKNGKITKADAIEYPTGNPRDQEINQYAVPALNDEVLKKQSGTIDAISGATVTSGGYIQSLQSAIDQAGL